MAEINLTIHGKLYSIACDDGQEQRVTELGRYADARLREIATSGGATGEAHLLVLTSLVLADEIYELREMLQNVQGQAQAQIRAASRAAKAADQRRLSEEEEQEILVAIDHLATRIDTVAERLQKV